MHPLPPVNVNSPSSSPAIFPLKILQPFSSTSLTNFSPSLFFTLSFDILPFRVPELYSSSFTTAPPSLPVLALKSPPINILYPSLFSSIHCSMLFNDSSMFLFTYTPMILHFSFPTFTFPSIIPSLSDIIPSSCSFTSFLIPITNPPIALPLFPFLTALRTPHTKSFGSFPLIFSHPFSSVHVSDNIITSHSANPFQNSLSLFPNPATFQKTTFHPPSLTLPLSSTSLSSPPLIFPPVHLSYSCLLPPLAFPPLHSISTIFPLILFFLLSPKLYYLLPPPFSRSPLAST